MFRALLLRKNEDQVEGAIEELDDGALPEGEVLVEVTHSTVNYKDGLVIRNKAPLVKSFPHVPGIDFAGRVLESGDDRFQAGEEVILTGWGVGERHWGGHATRARVPGEWLVKPPAGIDGRLAMAIGTAGFTAMLAIMALEDHGLQPGQGEVLVTGGAGGVGSVAITVLAKLGYQVATSTGRVETHDYLRSLGASVLIDRAELAEPTSRPLEKMRFAGCVDAVGGPTLARVLGQMAYAGSVAAVGNAGGVKLETTVIPFLLRGVNLLGIDSVMCPRPRREAAWARLASDLPAEKLTAMIEEVGLEDVPAVASAILKGQVRGRTVVDLTR